MVIDPVTAFLGDRDANSNGEVKAFITNLQGMAERYNVCIIMVSHLNKNEEAKGLNRIMGSAAWNHGPRTAILADIMTKRNKDSHKECRITWAKANYSDTPLPIMYELVGTEVAATNGAPLETSKVQWIAEIPEEDEEGEKKKEKKDARKEQRNEVKEWVWAMCVVECPGRDLAEGAEKQGFSYQRMIWAVKDLIEAGKLIKRRDGLKFFYSRAAGDAVNPVGPVGPVGLAEGTKKWETEVKFVVDSKNSTREVAIQQEVGL